MARFYSLALAATLLLTGCSSGRPTDTTPLPTASVVGKMVCGFVSENSIAKALGTSDFSLGGSSQDLGGAKNPDGSTLNEADCSAYTKGAPLEALKITVVRIGIDRRWDSEVPSRLAEGGLSFVFPQSEGPGFATTGTNADDAAEAHLIRGDWHYFVSIHPRVEGRDAVQDAVALVRQTVVQLGLPKVGKLPPPAVHRGA